MGIRVLGAAVGLPAPRTPSVDGALACARPFESDGTLSADTAKPVVLAALAMAKTKPDGVDLVIGRGLSPTHVADAPDVLGPRTAHAVQRECRMVNAFVFDVLDCDLNFNLDLAETFLASWEDADRHVGEGHRPAVGCGSRRANPMTLTDNGCLVAIAIRSTLLMTVEKGDLERGDDVVMAGLGTGWCDDALWRWRDTKVESLTV